MLTIYHSGPACPHCHRIMSAFEAVGKAYVAADMRNADVITELRTSGIFEMQAPIIHSDDDWYFVKDLFDGERLNEALVKKLVA